MTLKLCIGGTKFNLVVASAKLETSLLSTRFLESKNSSNEFDRDAIIELRDFTGTLYINHIPIGDHDIDPIEKEEEKAMQKNDSGERKNSRLNEQTNDYLKEDVNGTNVISTETTKLHGKCNEKQPSHPICSSSELLKNQEFEQYIENSSSNITKLTCGSTHIKNHSGTTEFENFSDDETSKKCKKHEDKQSQQLFYGSRKGRSETRLHQLCKSSKTKVDDLYKVLNDSPDYVRVRDTNGNLPLHLIAQNEHLIFGQHSAKVKVFIYDLIKEYPESPLELDDNGNIPFTTAIIQWIQNVHEVSFSVDEKLSLHPSEPEDADNRIPRTVYDDPLVDWSFNMLSQMFKALNTKQLLQTTITRLHSPAEEFLQKISSIPHLFKTCLLIRDDSLRSKILDFSYMKRCYLHPNIIGEWIVLLIAYDKTSSRVIDFFDYLSNLTPNEALGIYGSPSMSDISKFCELRENVINSIAKIENILPALFKLKDQQMKRACLTYPVQRIIEISMSNSSLLGLLLLDFCMLMLLLVAFDAQVALLSVPSLANEKLLLLSPMSMTTLVCIFLFFREDVSHCIFFKSYGKIFSRYKDIFELVETVSVFLVIMTNFAILLNLSQTSPWLLLCTKILIWIRIIGFLKGVNLHFAMFISSLNKVSELT